MSIDTQAALCDTDSIRTGHRELNHGDARELDQALQWVLERGVRVDPVEDSILEG